MGLDLEKPLRWKNDKTEVFATPTAAGFVCLEWKNEEGKWCSAWRERNALSLTDLENIPEKVTLDGWCNVYVRDGNVYLGDVCRNQEASQALAGDSVLARIHIHREITIGEGL